ncbi:alpha-(1,3)-fucosyltransferase 7 [Aplochiton taeniatus]
MKVPRDIKERQFSAMRKLLLFILLFMISLLFFLNGQGASRWGQAFLASSHNTSTPLASHTGTDRNLTEYITILLWHWPFGHSYSLSGNVCWDLYRIPHCRVVDQRSLYSSADLVVFHFLELVQGHQNLPINLPRSENQRWVLLSLESPENMGNLKQFVNVFNLTMSYRRDADITIPYGEILSKPSGTESRSTVFATHPATQNKSHLACWVVSNYRPSLRRSHVYMRLKQVVPVEVYGHWSNRVLSKSSLLHTISQCYFYLAFENSLSKDYITEKLWRNAYQAGAVPVVLGPPVGDYEAVAPPNSFIHVDSFTSVEDLGRYLQELAEDKERYAGYLAWQQNYRVKLYTDWRERLCKICTQYHTLPPYQAYSHLGT